MTHRPNTRELSVDASQLAPNIEKLLAEQFRVALVACHQDLDAFRVVYSFVHARDDTRVEVVLKTDLVNPQIPSLAPLSFPLSRFEREARDLYGVKPLGHTTTGCFGRT